MEKIAGTVGNGRCDCVLVLFARDVFGVWYVQPWAYAPYTAIGTNGRWESDTHLGTEYAALLVRSSYKPPAATRALPTVSEDVLAIARVEGKK